MSRKVFTAGEVLAAADVNSFLMDQTVMSFAGTAARGSAIPSPSLGMYTHLEDAPARTQFWNGSAWVSPFGSTLISEVNFTSSSGVSQNNVFTSQYDNYILQVNLSTSANADIRFRFRAGGSDYSGTAHFQTGIATIQTVGTIFVENGNGTTSGFIASVGSGTLSANMTIMAPLLTRATYTNHQSGSVFGDFAQRLIGHLINTSTAYDGITIYPTSGTITGTVRIYGMRNA